VLNCGTALDPLVEKWVHELKGSGDLDPMECISHRFVSGIDDPSIAYAAESLKLLKAEIGRRTERLRALPRELCPDKRVTREIAKRRSLKLWPIECTIDECQNLFGHDKYGKQAGEDATWIIKIGPAFGVYLILATQRPDSRSLPMGVSSNVSQRFCLKVMDQIANDMVLGTSAYKNGIRATTFRAEIDAGLGYQVGAAAHPLVVRTFYLNLPDTERVAKRARALREAAGTLSGVALGEDDAAPRRPRRCPEGVRRRQRPAMAGPSRAAGRAVPRPVGRSDRRRHLRRAARPRRAEHQRQGRRAGGPRLPPQRRGERGGPAMTHRPGSGSATRPGLRKQPLAATAATGPPVLTCAVAGSGTGPGRTEETIPWPSCRAPGNSTATRLATTNTATGSPAGCTRRATPRATAPGSGRATPKAGLTATRTVTGTGTPTGHRLSEAQP